MQMRRSVVFLSNAVALCVIAGGYVLTDVDRGSAAAHEGSETGQPIFKNVRDYKWTRILPDLGERSPEICFLHVDPKTGATKLMIRAPRRFTFANTGTARMRRTR